MAIEVTFPDDALMRCFLAMDRKYGDSWKWRRVSLAECARCWATVELSFNTLALIADGTVVWVQELDVSGYVTVSDVDTLIDLCVAFFGLSRVVTQRCVNKIFKVMEEARGKHTD